MDHFKELSQHLQDGVWWCLVHIYRQWLPLFRLCIPFPFRERIFWFLKVQRVYTFSLDRWCVLLDVRVSGSLEQILWKWFQWSILLEYIGNDRNSHWITLELTANWCQLMRIPLTPWPQQISSNDLCQLATRRFRLSHGASGVPDVAHAESKDQRAGPAKSGDPRGSQRCLWWTKNHSHRILLGFMWLISMNQVLYWNKATYSADPFWRLADMGLSNRLVCAKCFHDVDHWVNCFFLLWHFKTVEDEEVKAKPPAL